MYNSISICFIAKIMHKEPNCAFYGYTEKVDLRKLKGCWNPKIKLRVITHAVLISLFSNWKMKNAWLSLLENISTLNSSWRQLLNTCQFSLISCCIPVGLDNLRTELIHSGWETCLSLEVLDRVMIVSTEILFTHVYIMFPSTKLYRRTDLESFRRVRIPDAPTLFPLPGPASQTTTCSPVNFNKLIEKR